MMNTANLLPYAGTVSLQSERVREVALSSDDSAIPDHASRQPEEKIHITVVTKA